MSGGIGGIGRGTGGITPGADLDDQVGGAGAVGGTGGAAATGGAASTTSTGATVRSTATSGAAEIWATITKGTGGKATPLGANLDASGARRPVALGTNGQFSAKPGTNATTPAAIGDGLFAAASLVDDTKENLFDGMKLPGSERAKVLAGLKADMASVAVGKTPPAGLNATQALQMRSSASTVLLELMTAKDTPDAQKREAFALYRDALAAETNPMLKDGMAQHLLRLKDALPADIRAAALRAGNAATSQQPPYDAWFKNGNSTVSVDWSAGSESKADDIFKLKKAGFKVVSESYDKTVLEKTYTVNGKKTTFNVNVRPFSSNMYANMGDPKANMVVYTGHSNWGNNVRQSLANVGANAGDGKDKLVLTDLCVGKGEMQQFRDKFPKADLITTFTSSYFVEGTPGEEPESEGIHAILNTFQGIAARKGYDAIAEDVRKDNPWGEDHAAEGIDNNYVFPTDFANRRRVLDTDHDGQADVFDRLVDFSTFNVAEDTAREFQAVKPARTAKELVGTKVDFAAHTVNRLTIYSEVFEKQNSNSKVVSNGFYDPKPGDKGMFRFEKTKVDGKDTVLMQMSSQYAHMSEEALRMAACFEYNQFMAKNTRGWKLDAADTNMSGMILASHSLDTDAGYRDDQVWSEFLKAYHLPNIPRSQVESVKEVNHDYYSGSFQSIKEIKKTLPAATWTALGAASAGKI